MATAADYIKALHQRIVALEERVAALEAGKPDELDMELDLDLEGAQGKASTAEDPVQAGNVGSIPTASTSRRIVVTKNGVQAPTPTKQQRTMRKALVDRFGFEHIPADRKTVPTKELKAAYLKGGPAWLYFWDNRYCAELPFDVKQAMVKDLMLDDPEYAYDVAKDLLMVRDEEASKSRGWDQALENQAVGTRND